ncbi:hypothetical protein C8R44DRAFT_885790 [Mycena epipterygia]|nr:hypothetical protein C8R44DRAFT_885790 [Mycena epipterygia]
MRVTRTRGRFLPLSLWSISPSPLAALGHLRRDRYRGAHSPTVQFPAQTAALAICITPPTPFRSPAPPTWIRVQPANRSPRIPAAAASFPVKRRRTAPCPLPTTQIDRPPRHSTARPSADRALLCVVARRRDCTDDGGGAEALASAHTGWGTRRSRQQWSVWRNLSVGEARSRLVTRDSQERSWTGNTQIRKAFTSRVDKIVPGRGTGSGTNDENALVAMGPDEEHECNAADLLAESRVHWSTS